MTTLTSTADFLAEEILKIGDGQRFEIISQGGGKGLPLVAWKLKKAGKYDGESSFPSVLLCLDAHNRPSTEFAISGHLRQRGWIVPAYKMAPHVDVKLMRVVVREDFSRSRSQTFLRDLKEAVRRIISFLVM
jgi:glutamate decarboxylase